MTSCMLHMHVACAAAMLSTACYGLAWHGGVWIAYWVHVRISCRIEWCMCILWHACCVVSVAHMACTKHSNLETWGSRQCLHTSSTDVMPPVGYLSNGTRVRHNASSGTAHGNVPHTAG